MPSLPRSCSTPAAWRRSTRSAAEPELGRGLARELADRARVPRRARVAQVERLGEQHDGREPVLGRLAGARGRSAACRAACSSASAAVVGDRHQHARSRASSGRRPLSGSSTEMMPEHLAVDARAAAAAARPRGPTRRRRGAALGAGVQHVDVAGPSRASRPGPRARRSARARRRAAAPRPPRRDGVRAAPRAASSSPAHEHDARRRRRRARAGSRRRSGSAARSGSSARPPRARAARRAPAAAARDDGEHAAEVAQDRLVDDASCGGRGRPARPRRRPRPRRWLRPPRLAR